jgi:DNA-binding beta-propeller fold protein YncE
MAGIFLSYSRSDHALAQKVIDALRRIEVEVWWDQDMPSVDWQDELARELDTMLAVAVVWTPNSAASKYVRDEARLALHNEKLINIMAGLQSPPFPFDRVNGLPIDGWDGVSPHSGWMRVVQSIEHLAVSAGAALPGAITQRLVDAEKALLAARAALEDAERAFHEAQAEVAEATDSAAGAQASLKRAEADLDRVRATSVGPAILRVAQQEYDAAEAAAKAVAETSRAARARLSAASRAITQARSALAEPNHRGVPPGPPIERPAALAETERERAKTVTPAAPAPLAEVNARPSTAGSRLSRHGLGRGAALVVLGGLVVGLIVVAAFALWPSRLVRIIRAPSFVDAVAFSPDGRRIVAGLGDGSITVWDAANGKATAQISGSDTDWINSVAFSPDGKTVVSGSEDRTIRIWDTASGREVGSPLTEAAPVESVAYSPDGKRIASGAGNVIRIWDPATGQEVGQPLTGHTGSVESVAFSPDGKRIVSGSDDATVRIWDAASGLEIGQPLTGATSWVLSVAFSADGKRIVGGSWDTTIRIWDAASGEEIGPALAGHTDKVRSVAFSPDGKRIVSGSNDDTVRIWDAASGQLIGTPLTGNAGPVSSVAFSPDGKTIISGSSDHTVRIWNASGP